MRSECRSWRRRGGRLSERKVLMCLRWLIALTLLLLAVFTPAGHGHLSLMRFAVVTALVAINILLRLLSQERLQQWCTHPLFFVTDFGLMTTAMLLVTGVVEGIHLLYFLAVLIGASIASLPGALLTLLVVAGGYFAYNAGVQGVYALLKPQYLLCAPFLLVVVCLLNFISEQSRLLQAALERKSDALERTTELLHEREREYQAHQAESSAEPEQMYQRLGELNEYNRNALQSVSTGIVITDLSGRVTTCNRCAATILEVDPTEVLGRPLRTLERALPMSDLVDRAVAQRAPQQRKEVCMRSASGRAISLGVSISLLKNRADDVTGAIAFFQDITEVIALRDALVRSEKLAALGRITAEVAHEIRNPLNAIRGFSQLIREGTPENAAFHRYTGLIMEEVDRLSQYVGNVLDFARASSANRVPVDLWGLTEETVLLAGQKVEGAGVQVVMERDGSEAVCLGDPEKLKQVFLNMVLNAVEAMEGGGKLMVRVLPDPDPAFLRIQFEDTGCGIPRSEVRHIFDPFFTRKPGGTGLGLSVSNQIVEAHGGRIDVESTPGVGTIFTVRLPTATVPAAAASAAS